MQNTSWSTLNHQFIVLALQRVNHYLALHSGKEELIAAHPLPDEQKETEIRTKMEEDDFALDTLSAIFDLTSFEKSLLLLCAGIELDARTVSLCQQFHIGQLPAHPTFSLALAAFPDAHWDAISPEGALRYWQLLHLNPGQGLTHATLRIDERVLHYLVGISYISEELAAFVKPVSPPANVVPSHYTLAEELSATLAHARQLPIAELTGPDPFSRQQIAAVACAQLGLTLYKLSADMLPSVPAELVKLGRLWLREALLSRCALLIESDDADPQRRRVLCRFIENQPGVILVSGRERLSSNNRSLLTFDIGKPTTDEQHDLWQKGLGHLAPRLNGQITRLVSQFDLTQPDIVAASAAAQGFAAEQQPDNLQAELGTMLWQRARLQARPRLEHLAQRISATAKWEELILPAPQQERLQEIIVHVRQRRQVYEHWGFQGKSGRGLGITALFAGRSGTGKTLAAEVLAHELQLDLYRIDLSSVIDKYIGETEKNLRQIFDAAESGGAILLFDEADALFGKRSRVKDSHDRHANIEVSYLLQRMEAYRGLAILTTNLKDALDDAFLRRLRFIIEFPFPDRPQRAEIWARMFPPQTPTENLDMGKLARLNIAGGNIHNIALNAAFLAAEAKTAVQMPHLLEATRREYEKLQRPLTEAENQGVAMTDINRFTDLSQQSHIDLRIERLILHDVPRHQRHRIKAGVEQELARLLLERGLLHASSNLALSGQQIEVPAGLQSAALANHVAQALFNQIYGDNQE